MIRRLTAALALLALVILAVPAIHATAEPVIATAEVLRVVDASASIRQPRASWFHDSAQP